MRPQTHVRYAVFNKISLCNGNGHFTSLHCRMMNDNRGSHLMWPRVGWSDKKCLSNKKLMFCSSLKVVTIRSIIVVVSCI